MFLTSGKLFILGGIFSSNEAKKGGVAQLAVNSSVVIEGGTFESNAAENGGVIFLKGNDSFGVTGGTLEVKGGVFEGNSAVNGGGAFFVEENGGIEVRKYVLLLLELNRRAVIEHSLIKKRLLSMYFFIPFYPWLYRHTLWISVGRTSDPGDCCRCCGIRGGKVYFCCSNVFEHSDAPMFVPSHV